VHPDPALILTEPKRRRSKPAAIVRSIGRPSRKSQDFEQNRRGTAGSDRVLHQAPEPVPGGGLDRLRQNLSDPAETVIFLHTVGTRPPFAYTDLVKIEFVLAPAGIPVDWPRIDLSRSHTARIEIHRAGEVVHLAAAVRVNINSSDHPVVAPWIVVDLRPQNVNIPGTKALGGLIVNRVAADADGLVGYESMAPPPVILAIPVVRTIWRRSQPPPPSMRSRYWPLLGRAGSLG
jgi:hypothetical protein